MNHKTEPTPQDIESQLRAVARDIGTYRRLVINGTDVLIASGPQIKRHSFAAHIGGGKLASWRQGLPVETAHIAEHLTGKHLLSLPKDVTIDARVSLSHTSYNIAVADFAKSAKTFLDCTEATLSALSGRSPNIGDKIILEYEKDSAILERGGQTNSNRILSYLNIHGLLDQNTQQLRDFVWSVDSVNHVTMDHVKEFMKANYTKQNTVVAIASSLPEEAIIASCEKYLRLPEGKAVVNAPLDDQQGRLHVYPLNDRISDVYIRFDASPIKQAAFSDVPSLLLCGAEEILRTRIRDRLRYFGHAYSTYFPDNNIFTPIRPGFFACSFLTKRDPLPALKTVAETIKEYVDGFRDADAVEAKEITGLQLRSSRYEVEACDYWRTQRRVAPPVEKLIREILDVPAGEIKDRLSRVFNGFMAVNVATPIPANVPSYEEIRKMVAPKRPRQAAVWGAFPVNAR